MGKAITATYIGRTHDSSDLLHRIEIRAQTTVHGKNLLVDDSGDGKAVEAVGKGLPQFDIVATLAFIIETIDAVDRGTLMVTSENEEILRVLNLVGKKKADSL